MRSRPELGALGVSGVVCDVCGGEARTFALDALAPDILCCVSCAALSPAQVARRYLAPSWPRCPRSGVACRSGACAGCVGAVGAVGGVR